MKNNKAIPNHNQSINHQTNGKSNVAVFLPTRNQIRNNQSHILNKQQSKKIEPTHISSSLSLKKGNSQPNSNTLSNNKEIKVNPQSRNNQAQLTKTASTDKFILRNAMYIRQKTMKLQNQQRKKLYALTSQCKFAPQLQTSKYHQKSQKSQPPETLASETQRVANMGTYQLQYHKKLQYDQFGYSKKHMSSSIKNKDIKRLLNESAERFNNKLNSRQQQVRQQQNNKLLQSKTCTMSYGELIDINDNLIWISNQTQQFQTKTHPSLIGCRQHLIQPNSNIFLPDAPQTQLLDDNHQSHNDDEQLHSDCQILIQLKQNSHHQDQAQVSESYLQPRSLLENINDISDIPNQDHSLADSDLFNCPKHQTQVGRGNEYDELPKCFKKQHQAENAIEEHQLPHKVQQLDFASYSHPSAHIQPTIIQIPADQPNQHHSEQDTGPIQTIQLPNTQQSTKQIIINSDITQHSLTDRPPAKEKQKYNNHQQHSQQQVYVIDDYGNVILANSIQVHRVGMCQILVIAELPEQQARTSQS